MKYAKGRHPGATWRKTDLQVHTPRDAGWEGSVHLPGGTVELEAARDAWADQFVAECLRRNLGAVSITDHHDIVMYPYVARAIGRCAASNERLWLFPGMEVTCNDAVQCLILFDQGTTSEIIRRLFGIMPEILEPDSKKGQAPQTQLCGKDIKEFLGAVFADVNLNGKSIVLPHASQGGHKNILRKGFHKRFSNLLVDGVYNEKSYDALDIHTRRRIYGDVKDWGDRRHGIITTGDNRKANFEDLGRNECWIRLGEPTSEAIRQAVLADEARITYAAPAIPSQRILELRVNSALTGDKFELTFNDGFNTFIGGRGSGKSAILEYLRFGLGRSTLDMAADASSDRERDLVSSTLVGGYVEVDLDRDGLRETWRRTLDDQAHITVSTGADKTAELNVTAVQERFRARAFSQKQLSTLVRQPETVDEQITGIAAAESVDRRHQAEQDIEAAEREVQRAFQVVVQGWAANAAFGRARSVTEDLKLRIGAIRQRLEAEGLSESQRAILNEAPVYSRTDQLFDATDRNIGEQISLIEAVGEIKLTGWDEALVASEIIKSREELSLANDKIKRLKREIQNTFLDALNKLEISRSIFRIKYDKFKIKYDEANATQSHLTTLLSEYNRLSKELEQAQRHQQTADEARGKYSEAAARLTEARVHLTERLARLHEILSEAASRVDSMSEGILRAHVEEETIPERYFGALMDLCERCGIRDLEQKCREKVEEGVRNNRKEWEKLVHNLYELRQSRINMGDTVDIDPGAIKNICSIFGWQLTSNQATAILYRLDDPRLARLLSSWAAPLIRFEYRDRGSYMPFERASPGQQASALLMLLLNQEAGTLIIDQPEDDLDNKIIMSIVKLLQTTKRKRQLIFATHNPNFVVNGDADKVVALVPSVEPNSSNAVVAAQVEIETDGAIETPSVRKAITETMEGGMDAFELRGRKYAFAQSDEISR